MASFNLDLDGVTDLQSTLERLRQKGESDAVFVTGTTVKYGIILEFGRGPIEAQDADYLRFEDEKGNTIFRKQVSGHEPYPWFRPAVREFRANPEAFIKANTDFGSIDQIESTDELVKTIAFALQSQMEKNVNAQKAVDRSPGTHPDHPKRDTGTLTASIQATRIR